MEGTKSRNNSNFGEVFSFAEAKYSAVSLGAI